MSSGPPKVLILSDEGPQTGTAGGLLLYRLFSHHPPDRLRVLARHVPTIGDPLPQVQYHQLIIPWQRFESSRFHRLKRSLQGFGWVPKATIATIRAALREFQPDLVFCVMQHAQYYDTARQYAEACRLPLVVAVHDINDEFEPVYFWARAAVKARDTRFYRAAARRLCISPEMEKWCADRYGAGGQVLYPNRSERLRPRGQESTRELRHPGRLTIGFAGNLNYGYGEALLEALPAIRRAGVRLVLYSRPPGGAAADLAAAVDVCEFRGFVPSDEAWAGLQRDCDAVWLPYPARPDRKLERLYRHHFPSKLPEYLALGMPVLVTGPHYATGVRWARENPAAAARATGSDEAELADVFARLRADSGWREQLAERGWHAGLADFDPVKIREQFAESLASAVNHSPTPP